MFSLVSACSQPAKSCKQATPCSGHSANLEGNPIPDKGPAMAVHRTGLAAGKHCHPRADAGSSRACHMLWTGGIFIPELLRKCCPRHTVILPFPLMLTHPYLPKGVMEAWATQSLHKGQETGERELNPIPPTAPRYS